MMNKHDNGFVYPLTCAVAFIFTLFYAHLLNLYIVESKFYKETEQLYLLENIMQISTDEIKVLLKNSYKRGESEQGILYYPHGYTLYHVTPSTTDEVTVEVTCLTKEGRRYRAQFTYSFQSNKIMRWL